MKSICKSKLEHLQDVQQFYARQLDLSPKAQAESKLVYLQAFIHQLGLQPSGKADLERRFERFGNCERMPDEFTPHFYGRLRRWLDRDIEG